MSHANERGAAVIASLIIFPKGRFPDAFFRKMRKKHMTGHLSIFPGWWLQGKYNHSRGSIRENSSSVHAGRGPGHHA